jgi:hypothetical protein
LRLVQCPSEIGIEKSICHLCPLLTLPSTRNSELYRTLVANVFD